MLLLTACAFSQVKEDMVIVNVQNSSQKPVSEALVSIENKDHAGINFKFTNEDGKVIFLLNEFNQTDAFYLKVSSFGYSISRTRIILGLKEYTIILSEDAKTLTEVKVKGRKGPRVISAGDTLLYAVKDFISPQDRSLGDVLKKIPGIEVSSNGMITFRGNPIGKFYIEGDDLLKDRYNLATQNIRGDMVDTIQLIDNNQPIKVLQGIEEGRNSAVNIILKEKAKLQWIHVAEAGGGLPGQYDAMLAAMAFKPLFKTLNKISANNAGVDLLQETASLISPVVNTWDERNYDPSFLSTSRSVPSGVPMERWLFNESAMGLGNMLLKRNNQHSTTFNAGFVHQNETSDYNKLQLIYLPTDTISINEGGHDKIQNHIYYAGITSSVNNQQRYLNNELKINFKEENTSSKIFTNNRNISQDLSQKRMSVSNTFSSLQLIKKKMISEIISVIEIKQNPEHLLILPGVHESVLNNNDPYLNTKQKVNLNSFYTSNGIGVRLNNTIVSQKYTMGFSYMKESISSNLRGKSIHEEEINPGVKYNSSSNFQRFSPFVLSEFSWSNKKNSLTSSLLLDIPNTLYRDKLKTDPLQKTKIKFSPSFQYELKVGRENKLRVNGRYQQIDGFIQDVYEGVILSDYRTLVSNNLPFQTVRSKSAGANFNVQKSIKVLFANVGFRYFEQKYDWFTDYTIDAETTTQVAVPYQNSSKGYQYSGGFSKYLFFIRTNVELKYQGAYTRRQSLQNNFLFPVANISNVYSINLRKKISKIADVGYYISYRDMKSKNGLNPLSSGIKTWSHAVIFNVFPVKNVVFSGNIESKRIESMTISQFSFADGKIRYSFSKPKMDVDFRVRNINGLKQYTVNYYKENSFILNTFQLRPTSFFVQVYFNF